LQTSNCHLSNRENPRISRRDNSVIIKAYTNIKPNERLFDTEPHVDGDVIFL
jgi:hypothetical protein